MEHGPPAKLEPDAASEAKARLGLLLFGFYSLVYAGFVLINTISPTTMGETVFLELNLAVVYGFGLIILAVVMGLVYNMMCTRFENKMKASQGDGDV